MSWGSKRKFFIIAALVLAGLFLIAVTAIAFIYETPSCLDGKQNQDEGGIDCGGSCQYLCAAGLQEPKHKFVRQFSPGTGRTDVIAYLINPNPTAAIEGARYTVTLYDADSAIIGTKEGLIDLPPSSSTIPLFVPGFETGYRTVARAFLTFDQASLKWYRASDTRPTLSVASTVFTAGNAPRIEAEIRNPAPTALYQVQIVATVFDAENNAIAASASVIDIPASGSAPVVFTWNAPFTGEPTRTEVIPVIPM